MQVFLCNQMHCTFSGGLESSFPGDFDRSCATSCAEKTHTRCEMATANVFCYDNAAVSNCAAAELINVCSHWLTFLKVDRVRKTTNTNQAFSIIEEAHNHNKKADM